MKIQIRTAKQLHTELVEVFRYTRMERQNECMIQEQIQNRVSDELRLNLLREHKLSNSCRLDFFHQSTATAIEVKIKRSLSALISQLGKYAKYNEVQNFIVITTKPFETYPSSVSGKPIYWIPLWKNLI